MVEKNLLQLIIVFLLLLPVSQLDSQHIHKSGLENYEIRRNVLIEEFSGCRGHKY